MTTPSCGRSESSVNKAQKYTCGYGTGTDADAEKMLDSDVKNG